MKELYLVLRIELGSFAICSNFCLFLFFFLAHYAIMYRTVYV